MVHKEFVSEEKRANSAVYALVLEKLPKVAISRAFFFNMVHICGLFLSMVHICFLPAVFSKAVFSSALVLKHFLTNCSMLYINHPPFPPDLMSANFYQFYKVLIAVTEGSLHDVEDIKNSVTNELKGRSFRSLHCLLEFL